MKKVLFIFAPLLLHFALNAQENYPYPSLSPRGTIEQVVGNTNVKITYERPSLRNRKVFGKLVPWGEVWRTGAGACTTISFDQAVELGGQAVPAGTYSLFTIPNPGQWVVILNRDTTLYGSYNYRQEEDEIRFLVPTETAGRYYETLTFDIDLIPNNARIYLSWGHIQVHFELKTNTEQEISRFIKEQLRTGLINQSDSYAGAAEYHLYQGTNYEEALQLAERAITMDQSNGWARDLKVRIYERLQRYPEALQEIKRSIQFTRTAPYEEENHRARDMDTLKNRLEDIKAKMETPEKH